MLSTGFVVLLNLCIASGIGIIHYYFHSEGTYKQKAERLEQ